MTCPFCSLPETFVEDETVYVCGQHIPLTRNQARIFEVLWRRRGKITPHWLLWDAQWMDDWPDKAKGTTAVQIYHVRKALKALPLSIENLNTQGYLLTGG